jgi:hypothetical protein
VFDRAVIHLLPALVAVALLSGAPVYGADGAQAASTEWSDASAAPPYAKRAFHEEPTDNALIRRVDDQDDPDRLVRVGSAICWPPQASAVRRLLADQIAIRTHPACAAPPRGPPTA